MERLDGIAWGTGPAWDVIVSERERLRREAVARFREGELRRVTEGVTALLMVGEVEAARRFAVKEGYELMPDGSVEVGFERGVMLSWFSMLMTQRYWMRAVWPRLLEPSIQVTCIQIRSLARAGRLWSRRTGCLAVWGFWRSWVAAVFWQASTNWLPVMPWLLV